MPLSTKKKPSYVLAIFGMLVLLGLYIRFLQNHSLKNNPKYLEVSREAGVQFGAINDYMRQLKKQAGSAKAVTAKDVKQLDGKKVGNFKYSVVNVGDYGGKLGYCIVAKHVRNKGLAFYSSKLVKDDTWEGQFSYLHYVTGQPPNPDPSGPCNSLAIEEKR